MRSDSSESRSPKSKSRNNLDFFEMTLPPTSKEYTAEWSAILSKAHNYTRVLAEEWCAWKIGDGWWWSTMKSYFDELSKNERP